MEEVLNPQPPAVRDVLLSTSILEQVSAEAASELSGNEQAGSILSALARANGFVQPIGSGRYRYHPLFAEVLRLKLSREYPDRMASLHRRAARWYARNGQLTDAVRHAAQAGDWPLAASIVIDHLAIGEIIEPRGSPSLASEFAGMPHGQAWTGPAPHLVSAAVALSAGRPEASAAALDAAEGILERLPADQEAASRLAAAMIRLTASLRSGDLAAAAAAAARAEVLASRVPGDKLTRHPDIRARRAVRSRSGRAVVRPSRRGGPYPPGGGGRRDRFRRGRRTSGLPGASGAGRGFARPAAPRGNSWPARRPRPRRPASSGRPSRTPTPRHLSHWPGCTWNTMSCARRARQLKQADAALGVTPDKLIGAVAWLVAAYGGLAEGRAAAATQIIARARSGWPVPAWLDHRLSLAESRAYAAAGDIPAALAAAERAGRRHLAGGRGHPRPRLGGRRKRRERTACARARASGP